MNRRKILYFLDFPRGFGGAANTLIKQAELMKDVGVDVCLVIPLDRDGEVINEFQDRCRKASLKYCFLRYSVTAIPEDIDVVSLLDDYETVEVFISEQKPDIVHSTQLNIVIELVCRELKIPHVMNIYQIEDRFFCTEYPDVFPKYHICDSEMYIKKWNKHIKLMSRCIRNSCREVWVNERYDGLTFVCAGNICERKNQLNIIKAFQCLLQDGISASLILVGNDTSEYGNICHEYVEQNRLRDYVLIKGFVPFAEYEIARSTALICGSTIESFPNVIGEAMAAKVPVISTPVAGVPEVLIDGQNAYLTKGYEKKDIYHALRRFCDERNSEKQNKVIENAYQTYQREFSPKAVSAKLEDFYMYVLTDAKENKVSQFKIEQLKDKFEKYIDVFKANEYKFKRPENMRKLVWLLPIIREKMNKVEKKEVIIWGAGIYGAEAFAFLKVFFPEWKLVYYMDQKKTGEYLGIKIVKPDSKYWKECIIWIANVAGQIEAMEKLSADRKIYQEDFFIMAPRVW